MVGPDPRENPSVNSGYFKNSFAALFALSAPEPPPFFSLLLDLLLLDFLLLEPFLEVPPDSSTNFLALSM
jgi:hypothetical protein